MGDFRRKKTRWPPWRLISWDIFDLSSETADPNSTKLDGKQDLNVLHQVCVFRADRKNKMAALASDWLRHSRILLWNYWTEFKETWQDARSRCPLPSCVFWADRKNKMAALASDWLDIFDFCSETAEQNSTKLDREQDLDVLYQVLFFGPVGKTRWPLIGWAISTSLKPLNGIQQNLTESMTSTFSTKYVFCADRKNKMAALASEWLRHFRLLWNRWTKFNETWQEARAQCPLPSLQISDRSENKNGSRGRFIKRWHIVLGCTICGPLGLLLVNKSRRLVCNIVITRCFTSLKPLNRIWRNVTGSKNSMSTTKIVFFGPAGKTRWLMGRDILEFFSETAEQIEKTFAETWQEAGTRGPHPSVLLFCSSTEFVFFGPIVKTRWLPALLLADTFSTSSLKPLNVIFRNLTGIKKSTSSIKFVVLDRAGKNKMATLALAETFLTSLKLRKLPKVDRKQDLDVLYQVCIFQADGEKADGLRLRHFRLFPLKPLNEIQRNLTGSKISMSSTMFVFSGRLEKPDSLPASDLMRHFLLFLWNRWTDFALKLYCRYLYTRPCMINHI